MARLVIIDDHPVVREGLKAYLELQADVEVVGEASTLREAVDLLTRETPDLLLLDLQLPDGSGLNLLPHLRTLPQTPKVLVLTSFLDDASVREALRAGASGFLIKHSGPAALLDGIRAVLRGEMPLDPGAVKALARPAHEPLADLTPREREVLILLGRGLSNKKIAEQLGVAEKTVKTHVSNLLGKLELNDRVQAALFAKEHGL